VRVGEMTTDLWDEDETVTRTREVKSEWDTDDRPCVPRPPSGQSRPYSIHWHGH